MLEDKVDYEDHCSQDDRRDHHQDRRALKLAPGRPCSLLDELYIRLLQIVNKLSHLYFEWTPFNLEARSGSVKQLPNRNL